MDARPGYSQLNSVRNSQKKKTKQFNTVVFHLRRKKIKMKSELMIKLYFIILHFNSQELLLEFCMKG